MHDARLMYAEGGGRSTSEGTGMTLRRLWSGSEVPQDFGDVWSKVAVSPDGRFLVYNDGGLVRRDIATGETRRLTTEERAYSPRVSPDGRRVAYVARSELRLVSSSGNIGDTEPRVLYRADAEVIALQVNDWAPDGKQILAVAATSENRSRFWQLPGALQMLLIPVTDGAVTVLKTLGTTEGWAALSEHSAFFSSDGRYVVYDDAPAGSSETDIYFVATDGSREGPLVEYPGNDFVLGWVPGGDQLLFASERTGWFSAWTMRVTDGIPQGPPELVKDQLGPIIPIGLTRTGAYYYRIPPRRRGIQLGTFDAPTGRILAQEPLSVRSPNRQATPSWSPDGRYLAYTSYPGRGYTERRAVVILEIDTGRERILHPDLTWILGDATLRWSPNGRSLVTLAMNGQGIVSLYQIDVQSGEVSPFPLPAAPLFFQWSKDGKAMYYINYESPHEGAAPLHVRTDIRVHDLETGRTEVLYRPGPSELVHILERSPDGGSLAIGSGPIDSPHMERNAVLIIPTGGGRPREVARVEAGQNLNLLGWLPDGTHLLFNSRGALWRVAAEGGPPQRLGPAIARPYFHPDGNRVALGGGVEDSVEVWVMENFLPLKAAK